MNKTHFILAISILPGAALAGNYATCLLKHMPGLQNDAAAYAAGRVCIDEYPGGLKVI